MANKLKKIYIQKEIIKSMTLFCQTIETCRQYYKMGGSKRQKCNDRHFVIIRLFRNLIRNAAFTHSNTQKDITEQKRIHVIFLGWGRWG